MKKLVLQELWTDIFDIKIKAPYKYMVIIFKFLILFSFIAVITDDNLHVVIIVALFISNYMLNNNFSDCIYMIPGSVNEYIRNRYRLAVLIELIMYFVYAAAGCIRGIMTDGITAAFVTKQLFVALGYILYVFIKNTWLLYDNFTINELKAYKPAQGLSLVWAFGIYMFADISGGRITEFAPFMVGLAAVLGFLAYGIYIGVFVKKNIIIKTYK